MAGIVRADTFRMNTIKSQDSDVTAINIDTTGRILTPARPAFSVYCDTSQTAADYTSGVSDAACFDQTDFNIGNCVAISSKIATFTAPVNGLYQFNWCVNLQNTNAIGHASSYLYIYEGGTTLRYSDEDNAYRNLSDYGNSSSDTDYYSLPNSAIVQLSATDTVKVMLKTNGDTSVAIREGTRFNGYLVG